VRCRACSFDVQEELPFLERLGHKYYQCLHCGTVQTPLIRPECIRTENDDPEGRNCPENSMERLRRIREYAVLVESVVDYGCGDGRFVRFLEMNGVDALGVDKGNMAHYHALYPSTICSICLIEVIEHLDDPADVLKEAAEKLRDGGVLYIETCTMDAIQSSGDNSYIDPSVGHRTILSMAGIGVMCDAAGLEMHRINPTSILALKKGAT
jgi:SAM-dependent methyltransferase